MDETGMRGSQELLGHKSVRSTEHYSDIAPRFRKEAVAKVMLGKTAF
jgi:site-specific recombinase XerD